MDMKILTRDDLVAGFIRSCKRKGSDSFPGLRVAMAKYPQIIRKTSNSWSNGVVSKTIKYSDEGAQELIENAADGDADADLLLRFHAWGFIHGNSPLPENLRNYVLSLLAYGFPKIKKRRGRGEDERRNTAISNIVQIMLEKGYKLERNSASRRTTESACSMTAKELAKNGIHISEQGVAKVYRRYTRRFLRSDK